MRLSDQSLRGRSVIASDGIAIGEITILYLDGETRGLEAFGVKLRKDAADRLGVSRGMFHSSTLEIPIRLVQSIGDAVVLNAALEQLRTLLPQQGEPLSAH